ncbi:hypothetical protein T439DRAFT_327620 [Meredithblackwellia eburnea MCA 4105]
MSTRRQTLFSGGFLGANTSVSVNGNPASPSHGHDQPPNSPLPQGEQAGRSRPSDVLSNRLHEVKRITKSLTAYFEGLAAAHASHSSTLSKLSTSSIIQLPLPEQSLFLPLPPASGPGSGVSGGWAGVLADLNEMNKQCAEQHGELSKKVTKDVVTPLKKLRTDIKAHITLMEKEVTKLSDLVIKERESTTTLISTLSKSLAPASVPAASGGALSYLNLSSSTSSTTPPATPLPAQSAADDPFLHRINVDNQVKTMTNKENELLALVKGWQDKSELLEKNVWEKVSEVWRIWEETNSNLLLGNQQRSVLLSANVDSLPVDVEWNYFTKLNHLLPASLAPTKAEDVEYEGRNEPLTNMVREGYLERQKRFVRSWKAAFFVLTPSGNLHEYPTPDSPLSKPSVSIHLPACTLGPMPTPPDANVGKGGKQVEAMFTIEGPDGRNVYRARSWEELSEWWRVIERFTKVVPATLSSPPIVVEHDAAEGDIGSQLNQKDVPPLPHDEVDAEGAKSPDLPPTPSSPPALPPRTASSVTSITDSVPTTPTTTTSTVPTTLDEGGGDIGITSPPPESPSPPPILTEEPDSPSLSAMGSPAVGGPKEEEKEVKGIVETVEEGNPPEAKEGKEDEPEKKE